MKVDKTVRFEEEEGEEVEEEEALEVKGRKRVRLLRRRHKKQKEDDDFKPPPVSFLDLLKLNIPDWYFVLLGIIFSAIIGCLFPLMAILFSEALRVGEKWVHKNMKCMCNPSPSFSRSTILGGGEPRNEASVGLGTGIMHR